MKKIIWPGILAGLTTLILGMGISYLFMLFPSVNADYYNTGVMRPWKDPIMSLFFLYPFVQGIILAWAWNKAKGLFTGTAMQRGMSFGFSIFLVATIPGMLVSYSSFPLSLLTIISWTVSGLVCITISGMIFAKMNA
ncbi:hypothetical protein A2480_00815 [Candidatus Uhrbacteria bacterium RIFOXYC2_FULL_47_19]|uniref:DUF1761 domain-containing protein n=1 Tax=Candidatus Uhrbacteria bacterium RIFOXYC2_FULL_47_19 TaxID=1802424 RepID=A0A1F7WFI1_9BACT|nr:MAG: hypothetical protein A2480_00815 [Candidatus Uhrbacteria bacterium RIFOXYC2_FULL_47_19]HCC22136.1 hypothetical protein [Candidatus Uhrbacteria bacterium]